MQARFLVSSAARTHVRTLTGSRQQREHFIGKLNEAVAVFVQCIKQELWPGILGPRNFQVTVLSSVRS